MAKSRIGYIAAVAWNGGIWAVGFYSRANLLFENTETYSFYYMINPLSQLSLTALPMGEPNAETKSWVMPMEQVVNSAALN